MQFFFLYKIIQENNNFLYLYSNINMKLDQIDFELTIMK